MYDYPIEKPNIWTKLATIFLGVLAACSLLSFVVQFMIVAATVDIQKKNTPEYHRVLIECNTDLLQALKKYDRKEANRILRRHLP